MIKNTDSFVINRAITNFSSTDFHECYQDDDTHVSWENFNDYAQQVLGAIGIFVDVTKHASHSYLGKTIFDPHFGYIAMEIRMTAYMFGNGDVTWGNIKEVFLHECAHVLAGYHHGHDQFFCSIATALGVKNPSRHATFDLIRNSSNSKYTLVCPECGTQSFRSRMPRGARYLCVQCDNHNIESIVDVTKNW